MHELCKVQKDIVDKCLPFLFILSTINNPTYKLAKFLVPVLKSLTNNAYTVKESFAFVEEIVDQDSKFFMGSLYVDLIFTNIPLEGTIDIYTNAFFEYNKYNELSDISDVQIIHENKKINLSVHDNFYSSHFDISLPSTSRFGTVYTLTDRCFQVCSSWTELCAELDFLKQISLKTAPLKILYIDV